MGGFPLAGWLILIVPPALMITSVLIWYFKEVQREKLEDELLNK